MSMSAPPGRDDIILQDFRANRTPFRYHGENVRKEGRLLPAGEKGRVPLPGGVQAVPDRREGKGGPRGGPGDRRGRRPRRLEPAPARARREAGKGRRGRPAPDGPAPGGQLPLLAEGPVRPRAPRRAARLPRRARRTSSFRTPRRTPPAARSPTRRAPPTSSGPSSPSPGRRCREGGTFLAKIFGGAESDAVFSELKPFFRELRRIRPEATRKGSFELYFLGKGFKGG